MSRLVAEDLKTISIYKLREWGLLKVDSNTFLQTGSLEWFKQTFEKKTITASAEYSISYRKGVPTLLKLIYSFGNVNYDYDIEMTQTKCNYGGVRHWLVCPGIEGKSCGRRIAKLYLFYGRFSCRHCLQLTYESNNRTKRARLFDNVLGTETELNLEKHLLKTRRYMYAGRPTKKAAKLIMLRQQTARRAAAWAETGFPL